MLRLLRVAIAVAALSPTVAVAQQVPANDAPHGQTAIGAGIAPDYDGSDEVGAIPFLLGDVRYRGMTLELRGLRGRIDPDRTESGS